MNFLERYLFYNSGNEVNRNYHLWTALSVLASCASRHVWCRMGYFTIYPNLYVVLLGPAGNGKTTAMRCGKDIVSELGSTPLSADCQSTEDLVRMLARDDAQQAFIVDNQPYVYTHLSLFITELSQFIGIDPAKMIDFFVTIYDADQRYVKRTIKHGPQEIVRPCICLLGCTVPDWVSTYLKTDIITGGFSRRCVFVVEDLSDRRVPWPVVTEEQLAARADCLQWCKNVQGVTGEFCRTDAAIKWWDNWYMTRKISRDPNIASFDKTRHVLVLKLAMLLQLGKSLDLVLDVPELEYALALTNTVMDRLPDVFGCVGRNELAQVGGKLLNILARQGAPMPEKEVQALLWRDAPLSEQVVIIQQLMSQGKIVRFTPKDNPLGRTFLALADKTLKE